MNGTFLIVRIDEDETVPYRGAVAHLTGRKAAFDRLADIQSNNSARGRYEVLRVYKAKKPREAHLLSPR